MNDQLRQAVEEGDMNMLYSLIPGDPHIFEHIDKMPFVDTPLHVAAEHGHTKFAAEIMRLKPSFSYKLNYRGFTPIHIALKNEHYIMVQRFVQIDKELVRVKGREGFTPLHFVTQMGETYLLAEFLSACPNSIEDVTDKNETAFHIAVKNRQIEALKILVGWLSRIRQKGAAYLERSILNWKDEEGNTILHISALLNYSESVRFLINTKVNINAKNFNNSTALDIIENQQTKAEIKIMLSDAGALNGHRIRSNSSLVDKLRSTIGVFDKIAIKIGRYKRSITDDTRNALLVVAVLIATAAYQAALSPPGGVYQVDASNLNVTDHDHIGKQRNSGKSVMGNGILFLTFWLSNTISITMSILIIRILLPTWKFISTLLAGPLYAFLFCYFSSMMVISPSHGIAKVNCILSYVDVMLYIGEIITCILGFRDSELKKNKDMESIVLRRT